MTKDKKIRGTVIYWYNLIFSLCILSLLCPHILSRFAGMVWSAVALAHYVKLLFSAIVLHVVSQMMLLPHFQSTRYLIIGWNILHISCLNFWNITRSVACGMTDCCSLPAVLFFVGGISQLSFRLSVMSGVFLIFFFAREEPVKFAGPSRVSVPRWSRFTLCGMRRLWEW